MNSIKGVICLIFCLTAWLVLQDFVLQGFAQTTSGPAVYVKQAAISQTGQTVHVAADSPRPLEQTLNALQQKYGWIVNYEDPQYVSHLDFVDAPKDASAPQVPAGGSFSVDFPAGGPAPASASTGAATPASAADPAAPTTPPAPDEEKTLHLVLDAYNHSKNPGQFELRLSSPGNFSVVGTAAHNEKGAIAQQEVLFDLPVTLPTEERTIVDTVNLICQAVAQQSHITVTLGIYPRTLIAHTQVKAGGTKVSARDLLQQSLSGAHRNLYWRLLYDPSSKGYFLSLHAVRPA
jgi:hypothetical protein